MHVVHNVTVCVRLDKHFLSFTFHLIILLNSLSSFYHALSQLWIWQSDGHYYLVIPARQVAL